MKSSDIWGLLKNITEFKKLLELPDQIQALEEHVAKLESKLKLPICESCGEVSMRLQQSKTSDSLLDMSSVKDKIYRCDHCNLEETITEARSK